VFKRKIHGVSNKGIAVMVLGDCSGSMQGKEYDCMAAGAILLNEAITPLGIPCNISLFTDDYKSRHFIVKDFEERRHRNDLLKDFYKVQSHMGCNSDGEAVLWAYKLLKQRKEERKLLIVLSDGLPASTASGDAFTYTQDVVAMVSKDIECYGIGIQSNSVRQFYPDHTVLNDPSELEDCLLEVIKQRVFA
jgi:cobalamin biosynthesis protein CobT